MQIKLQNIKSAILKYDKIALFHHIMIDGDSLSSSYGLALAIKAKYPQKKIFVIGDYGQIQARFPYLKLDETFFSNDISGNYLSIIGDCAVKSRVSNFEIYEKGTFKIAFDHHQNGIDFNTNIFWQESDFVASSMQSYLIAHHLEVNFTEQIALALVFGVITDSGRFKYSGAEPLPLKMAAKMYQHIGNKTLLDLFAKMEKRTLADLKFQAWVFEQLKIKEKVAYVLISKTNQKTLQRNADQCVQIGLISNIEGSNVWIFFIEYPDFIRVELRSNGVPVNKVASQFGGGGHIRAAGCKLESLDQAMKVVKATAKAIREFEKNENF